MTDIGGEYVKRKICARVTDYTLSEGREVNWTSDGNSGQAICFVIPTLSLVMISYGLLKANH
jgi:hypothetical protein